MKENKFYCCSIYDDKEIYYNKMFDSYEDAFKAGLETIKEFNENLDDDDYMADDDIFDDELQNLLDLRDDIDMFAEFKINKIEKFYIHEFKNPEIPKNCGDHLIDYIDNGPWERFTLAYDDYTLRTHLGEEGIEELNQIIYAYLDRKTDDYKQGITSDTYTINAKRK